MKYINIETLLIAICVALAGVIAYALIEATDNCEKAGGVYLSRENLCIKSALVIK